MTITPALVDRIVAEVSRRLAAEASGAVDLRSERVLTGELIEARCRPGQTIQTSEQVVWTPTARDAARKMNLATGSTGSLATSPKPTRAQLQLVQTGPMVDAVARILGWPSTVTDTDDAIAATRSAICRGESDFVVVTTTDPHRVAARLNRQRNVWAAAVPPGCDLDTLGEGWNVLCLQVAGYAAIPTARRIAAMAATTGGTQ